MSRSEFLLLCHRRRVAGLSMSYKVNSNSNYCLFSELPYASCRVRLKGSVDFYDTINHFREKCYKQNMKITFRSFFLS